MRILISNDDGVYAEGLNILRETLSELGEVIVVAPLSEQSTTGHSLTMNRPIRARKIKEGVFGVDGFPADCIQLALNHLCKETPPDVIISGINHGANLGQDIYYSGTVAAARQGTFGKVPSFAISTVFDRDKPSATTHYLTAALVMKHLITLGAEKIVPPNHIINVNVPNCELNALKGIKLTSLGFRDYSNTVKKVEDQQGRDYYWVAGPLIEGQDEVGSDCEAISTGFASLSLINSFYGPNDQVEKWRSLLKNTFPE